MRRTFAHMKGRCLRDWVVNLGTFPASSVSRRHCPLWGAFQLSPSHERWLIGARHRTRRRQQAVGCACWCDRFPVDSDFSLLPDRTTNARMNDRLQFIGRDRLQKWVFFEPRIFMANFSRQNRFFEFVLFLRLEVASVKERVFVRILPVSGSRLFLLSRISRIFNCQNLIRR